MVMSAQQQHEKTRYLMVWHSDVTCSLYNEIATYLLVTDEDHFVVWMQLLFVGSTHLLAH